MDFGVHRRLWDQSPVDVKGQHVLEESKVTCRFLTVQVFGSSNPLVFQQLNVFMSYHHILSEDACIVVP